MKIIFTKRAERGLHCRFCGETKPSLLLETSPVKGIVCSNCAVHLIGYIDCAIVRGKK